MNLFRRNNGVYYIRFINTQGKPQIVSTGERTKAEAYVFLNQYKEQLRSKPQTITLKELIQSFLKHSELIHTRNTQDALKSTFRNFKELINPETELSRITTSELRAYFEARLRTSGIYQVRKDRINLSSLFQYAVNNELLTVNPVSKIKPFRLPEKQPLFFSETEFNELLRATPSHNLRNLYEVAFLTGLRLMELLSLQWSQIDFKNQLITLDNRTTLTKSKKVRTIPLNLRCLQILTELDIQKCGDFVFTDTTGKPYKGDYISHQFKASVRKAAINPQLHFHSLRHGFASLLIQKGVSLFFVSKLLGHSNTKTTEIYSHLRQSDLQDVVNLLNQTEDICNK